MLRVAQPEHEIRGKACKIALYLLVEALRRYPVERGEVDVDHNLMAADDENLPGDVLRNGACGRYCLLRDAAVFHAGSNGPDVRRVDTGMLANTRQSARKPITARVSELLPTAAFISTAQLSLGYRLMKIPRTGRQSAEQIAVIGKPPDDHVHHFALVLDRPIYRPQPRAQHLSSSANGAQLGYARKSSSHCHTTARADGHSCL